MFYKLGLFTYRARWWIVAVWVVVILAGGTFAPKASTILKSGGFSLPDAESVMAINQITDKFGGYRSTVVAVFTAPAGIRADDPAYAKKVDDTVARARNYPDTKAVLTYASTGEKSFISTDGRYTYALIGMKTTVDDTEQKLDDLKATLDLSNRDMLLTGLPVIYKEVNLVSQSDLEKAEQITLPLALIVLLIVFRTLVAAAMPLIVAMCSVVTTLAVVYFLGQSIDLSIFVLNIATILGLGVGIDYSLFMVNRFREELHRRNGNVEQAVAITVNTAGRATLFSGLTVMIGMSSLLLFQFMALRSQGIGGALVVFMSVIASLTLLPAVMSILGRRINRLKVPFLKHVDDKLTQAQEKNGFWHKLAEFVMRHPITILVVVLAFLGFIGSPFFHVRFGEPSSDILPKDNPARVANDILKANFPESGSNSDVYLLVEAKNGLISDPENVAALSAYTQSLAANPTVKKVISPVNLPSATPITPEQYVALLGQYNTDPSKLPPQLAAGLQQYVNGKQAVVKLETTIEYSSSAARQYIESLRAQKPATLKVMVSGEQAGLMDFVDKLYSDFPIAILLVIVITYCTLLIMFQSAILPIKAVVMTSLSLSASYGGLVWMFQDGNLSNVLGFQVTGYVEATLPVMMFGVLFGLSMDYEVFLLSRIKEVYDETGDNSKSVALGLERTGGIITSAAMIMIIVAGAFSTAEILIVKAIGIGMVLAVALDASVVRALLVPATMKLLGKWNWWLPGFVVKRLPKVTVE